MAAAGLNATNGRSRPTFNRLDRNGDGALTPQELAQNDAAVARNDTLYPNRESFDSMDDNNNEIISRIEWRGNFLEFNRYDINRDGVISRREMRGGRASRIGIDRQRGSHRFPSAVDQHRFYLRAGDVIDYRASA